MDERIKGGVKEGMMKQWITQAKECGGRFFELFVLAF